MVPHVPKCGGQGDQAGKVHTKPDVTEMTSLDPAAQDLCYVASISFALPSATGEVS